MKTLTLHQPWASLIRDGDKAIETRSWPAPKALVGQRIAIHAGKRQVGPDKLPTDLAGFMAYQYGSTWDNSLPSGAVVCTATLARLERVIDVRTVSFQQVAYFSDIAAPEVCGG